jgi:hypothetical protein
VGQEYKVCHLLQESSKRLQKMVMNWADAGGDSDEFRTQSDNLAVEVVRLDALMKEWATLLGRVHGNEY